MIEEVAQGTVRGTSLLRALGPIAALSSLILAKENDGSTFSQLGTEPGT